MHYLIEQIKSNTLLRIAIVVAAVYIYFNYIKKEGLDNTPAAPEATKLTQEQIQQQLPPELRAKSESAVEPKQKITATDLLPRYDESNEFAKQNPVSNLLKEQNFLISGYHVGINTQGTGKRIAYLDLRSAPPIPKDNSLSVWNQSSFSEPAGSGRRQMEII